MIEETRWQGRPGWGDPDWHEYAARRFIERRQDTADVQLAQMHLLEAAAHASLAVSARLRLAAERDVHGAAER